MIYFSLQSHTTLRGQFAAALEDKVREYERKLEQEVVFRKEIEEEMGSKIKDLEHKLALLERSERKMTTVLVQASPLTEVDYDESGKH